MVVSKVSCALLLPLPAAQMAGSPMPALMHLQNTGWGPAVSRVVIDQLMSWYVTGTTVLGGTYRQVKKVVALAIAREAKALTPAAAVGSAT